MPTTPWQLGVYIAMMAIGGGLMFKGLKDGAIDENQVDSLPSGPDKSDVLEELAELRAKLLIE